MPHFTRYACLYACFTVAISVCPAYASDVQLQKFWPSGGSVNTNLQSSAVEWGTFRGRNVDLVTVYSTRDTGWNEFVRSHALSGQPKAYNDPHLTLIIQTSPFPTNVNATYAALLAGEYDTYWREIGRLLHEREQQGFTPVILSPGWEMNSTYMAWGGGEGTSKYASPAIYQQGFAHIVEQLRSTYPQIRIAWTINGHGTPSSTGTSDAFDLYPGDAYVDYMGIDDYDHYPPALTHDAFLARSRANGGILWLAKHAREHGKKLLVPEWGVVSGNGTNGGGDNPNYIQWMHDVFRQLHEEGLFAGEFYFADPMGGGNVDSDLLQGNPDASARYKTLWDSGTP
jgi:beta-mannanase